jgi:exonuclease VII large subunit
VLQRGYALAVDARGAVVSDAASLQPGAMLSLRFARGAAVAHVDRVLPDAGEVAHADATGRPPG